MVKLYVLTVLAAIFFTVWPMLMNRSGLNASVSSAFFALGCLIVVAPFAFKGGGLSLATVNWKYVAGACILGGLGLLAFNGMLAKAPPSKMGTLFLTLLMTQVTVSAICQVYQAGTVTPAKAAGFATAALTVYLLA